MNISNLIVLNLLISVLTTFAHAETVCTPKTEKSQWRQASITWLEHSVQALHQIQATGNFLTADLICNYEECVGFIGGVKASGTLFTGQDNEPLGFTLRAGDQESPIVEFSCQQKIGP